MWVAAFAVCAFLQAGGVLPGRSCEPGNRDAPTAAIPSAVEVARAVTLGLIGEVASGEPEPDASPTPAPAPANVPG